MVENQIILDKIPSENKNQYVAPAIDIVRFEIDDILAGASTDDPWSGLSIDW